MPFFHHRNLTVGEAEAVKELTVLEAVTPSVLGAQAQAANRRVRIACLDEFAKALKARREELMTFLEGTGVMYAAIPDMDGAIQPKGFKAREMG